jgi:two-component system chemotaxis sensor kinase CheA
MDVSEYLPMFLAECREHLQELNLAVVRIEENPADTETVNEIFRIAHSLKGSSATMGFARMAALAHEMENVFELLRQRSGGLAREAIDVLLECLDALGECVDAIDAESVERLAEVPLVERLKGLVRSRDEVEAPEAAALEEAAALAAAGDRRALRVTAELTEDALMPAVRAYQVLARIGDFGEVLGSAPVEEELEGFTGVHIEAYVATDAEPEALVAALLELTDVARASAEDVEPAGDATPAAAAPASAARAEPESAPAGERAPRKTSGTVRVDAERLDQLMHLMGELVVARTHVESLVARGELEALPHAMQDLTRASQALQAMVMQVRMIPVEAVFLRFPRLVRDLSARLGKQVELVMEGKDTELDRTVVDALGDPLVHLIRNAIDHGLEPPEERVAAGKPATGTIRIAARHAGGNVVISVSDDGRGVDPARVGAKAAERGLLNPEAAAQLDVRGALELLFAPGFSTACEATEVSGRGVGMDAVRTMVRELGGEVVLTSEPGAGTTAQIRLPLTLAIMAALLVRAQGQPLAIPLDRVERTLRLADHGVRSVAGTPMLVLRDGVLPLVDLAEALGHGASTEATHAVIVGGAGQRLALAVSELVGQHELVTRPLPPEAADGVALSGAAVLSSGEIALIVDCDALAEAARTPLAAAA